MNLQLLLVVCVVLVHVWVCPFTKVEESFNLQAMHDLLYHTSDIDQFDHLEFPGVVPRSFIGPMIISSISAPFVYLASVYNMTKFANQLIVRSVLGIFIAVCFDKFRKSISHKFGPGTGWWLTLLNVTQFHFMFYASRPLPNIFALGFLMLALHYWVDGKHGRFIWTSGFSIIVFRAELLLFLGIIVLLELHSRRLSFSSLFLHAVPAGITWLTMTVIVDSYFWQRLLWPEGEVFWYNTILNKSSNWGTSPFLWYFYSALPRALVSTLLLVPLGVVLERRTLSLLVPALGFVFLFSFLPHKELRFIIYTIPVFTTVSAAAADRIWKNRRKGFFRRILSLAAVAILILNSISTVGFTFISHLNYPGGEAMYQLHQQTPRNTPEVHVHIDVASAQTGISRFTQLYDHWKYNKTENLAPYGADMMSFTHLLIEVSDEEMTSIKPFSETHKTLYIAHGFAGIKHNLAVLNLNQLSINDIIRTEPRIALLKRVKILS